MDKTNIIGEKIKGLRMAKEISLDNWQTVPDLPSNK